MLKELLKKWGGEVGVWIALIFILVLFSIYSKAAYAYAGNIYVDSAIDGTPYFLKDSTIVNTGTQTLRSAHNMPAGTNMDTTGVANVTVAGIAGTWTRYNVVDTSVSSMYVLFVKAGKYSLQGSFDLGSSGVVKDHYISSPLTYYSAATPPAPIGTTLSLNGLAYPSYDGQVSSAIGTLASGYEQSGTKFALYEVQAGDTLVAVNQAGASGSGTLSSYPITGSKGKTYRVKMAYVNAFTTTDGELYGDSNNQLIPSGGGGANVYGLGIKLLTNPTNSNTNRVELSWSAVGASTFDIYWSQTGVYPGSYVKLPYADGVTPYTSPAAIDTTAVQAAYFTVVPSTVSSLNDQPRQIVGKYTFLLRKPAGKTGINSIAMPFSLNYSQATGADVADTPLLKAADLKNTIANFEYVGGFDASAQLDFGYLANGTGNNFDLLQGVGYQVSVSADNTYYTVVGVK